MRTINSFHDAILELAAKRNLTANAFAARVGVAYSYAQQMFSGAKSSVGHGIAIRIADVFGESRLKWLRIAGYGDLLDAGG